MAQEVINALVATLSDDKNSREAAEQSLETLCCQSGNPSVLAVYDNN
jgi:hypothetical protein